MEYHKSLNSLVFSGYGCSLVRILPNLDVHILNFLADTLNEKFPQTSERKKLEAVDLIEEASAHSEFSARSIDRIIWIFRSEIPTPSSARTAIDRG